MARWAAVIIAGFTAMKSFSSREVEEAKFCDEVSTLFELWVNTSKGLPVHSVEGSLIPVQSIVVVVEECRKPCFCAYCSFEASGDCDAAEG